MWFYALILRKAMHQGIRHEHYSRCNIWFTALVSMGGADDTPQAAWKIGWPWEAALYSSLMTWSDLKGFDWYRNEAYFVKSFSSIFSNLFFLCASEFARIGCDKDGGPFLFGRNKKTLLNHQACNPKKIKAMTISSLAPCIWSKRIDFYNRSGRWLVMSTPAHVIHGTWGCKFKSWLRKEATNQRRSWGRLRKPAFSLLIKFNVLSIQKRNVGHQRMLKQAGAFLSKRPKFQPGFWLGSH